MKSEVSEQRMTGTDSSAATRLIGAVISYVFGGLYKSND